MLINRLMLKSHVVPADRLALSTSKVDCLGLWIFAYDLKDAQSKTLGEMLLGLVPDCACRCALSIKLHAHTFGLRALSSEDIDAARLLVTGSAL